MKNVDQAMRAARCGLVSRHAWPAENWLGWPGAASSPEGRCVELFKAEYWRGVPRQKDECRRRPMEVRQANVQLQTKSGADETRELAAPTTRLC